MIVPRHDIHQDNCSQGEIYFDPIISSDIHSLCVPLNHSIFFDTEFYNYPSHYNSGNTSTFQFNSEVLEHLSTMCSIYISM